MAHNFLMTFPAVLLCALLGTAVWSDVRTRRIPNLLVFPGAVAGLMLNAVLPAGAGLFSAPLGGLGLWNALCGLGLGLAILMPMYILRAMGAGDVKLLAMLGAFLGPHVILSAAIACLLAGGVLSLGVACWKGSLRKILQNSYQMLLHSSLRVLTGGAVAIDAPQAPSGKLPYAIAITIGALPYILLARDPGVGLFL